MSRRPGGEAGARDGKPSGERGGMARDPDMAGPDAAAGDRDGWARGVSVRQSVTGPGSEHTRSRPGPAGTAPGAGRGPRLRGTGRGQLAARVGVRWLVLLSARCWAELGEESLATEQAVRSSAVEWTILRRTGGLPRPGGSRRGLGGTHARRAHRPYVRPLYGPHSRSRPSSPWSGCPALGRGVRVARWGRRPAARAGHTPETVAGRCLSGCVPFDVWVCGVSPRTATGTDEGPWINC